MKHNLYLIVLLFITLNAQVNIQVPKTALFYMEINGGNINKKINWQTFNQFGWIQDLYSKKDKRKNWNDYSESGIDYKAIQHHYAYSNDSVFSYVAIFPLKDNSNFSKFIENIKHKGLEVLKKNKYQYVSLDKDAWIAWNNNNAVFYKGSYSKPYKYNHYIDSVAIEANMDSAVAAIPEIGIDSTYIEAPFDYKEEITYLKEQKQSLKEEIVEIDKNIKHLEKYHKYPEENIESYNDYEFTPPSTLPEDNIDTEHRNIPPPPLANEEEEDYTELENYKIVKQIATQLFDTVFNGINTIDVSTPMIEMKNEKADIYIWNNLYHLYSNEFKNNTLIKGISSLNFFQDLLSNIYNSHSYYNLFFDKDKIKMVHNYKHDDETINKELLQLYKAKPNKNLEKFLSSEAMAYYYMNINSEKYFDLAYHIVNINNQDFEYKKEYELMVETIKIMLDEKAISKIAPGNGLFVLNNLKNKTIEYIDYEYDDNFNSKEVKKNKEVVVPDFTFAFATENEGYWQKIFEVIAKNKKISKEIIKKGDIFSLIPNKNSIIEEMHFTVKNGIVLFTTSLKDLELLNKDIKSNLSKEDLELLNPKYALSGKIETKKILNGIEKEFEKKSKDYEFYDIFKRKIGDFIFYTNHNKNSLETTIEYQLDNMEDNGLMHIFYLLEDLYKIDQKSNISNM